MSYTVVVDEAERERRFENRLNAVVRHCRIGKVASKRPVSVSAVFPMPSWPRTACTARDILGDQRVGVSVPSHGVML